MPGYCFFFLQSSKYVSNQHQLAKLGSVTRMLIFKKKNKTITTPVVKICHHAIAFTKHQCT